MTVSDHLADATGAIVLAHQGGWDEILFILGPIAVVVVLLTLAKRRVDRMALSPRADRGERGDTGTGDTGPTGLSPADDARPPHPRP